MANKFIKRSQLEELIGLITKNILKEYTSLMSTAPSSDAPNDVLNPDIAPQVPISAAEKARIRREKEHQKQIKIKQGTRELDAAKAKLASDKKQVEKEKHDVPNLTKTLQRLKSGQI